MPHGGDRGDLAARARLAAQHQAWLFGVDGQHFGDVARRRQRFDAVGGALQGRGGHQVFVRRDAGKILRHVVGRALGIDPAVFHLDRHAVFKMHDQRMKQRVFRRQAEVLGQQIRGLGAFQQLQAAAVDMPARAHFIGDTFDFQQGRLVFLLRHIGAGTLAPRQYLLAGQFAHGAVDRHARDAELFYQGLFGGNHVAFLPASGGDARQQKILDALENGRIFLGSMIVQCGFSGARAGRAAGWRRDGRF